MRRRLTLAALAAALTSVHAAAQSNAKDTSAPPLQLAPPAAFADANWAVRLAARVGQVELSLPIVSQVVLVPDAATYLDELGRWSPEGRWPVLFEDEHAALFIRAFQPKRVLRRGPVATRLPADRAELERALDTVVVKALGGDPATTDARKHFAALGYAPPGVVIASVDDPAWPGAIALAAGRALPLVWLDDALPGHNAVLDATATAALVDRVRVLLDAEGRSWRTLGDDVDAIALCRNAPGRARLPLPEGVGVKVNQPGVVVGPEEPLALTDLLGRSDDWSRAAFVGWMPGNESESAYRAMCALFLPRGSVALFNGYPLDGAWGKYDTAPAAALLAEQGDATLERRGDDAGPDAWLELARTGWDVDLAFVNSSGNPDFFNLGGARMGVGDVPTIDRPLALQMIHSWSLARPGDINTVGGRWLSRGVYAYTGSVQEPFLPAFVPPGEVARRIASAVPFLVSTRQWNDLFSRPWRVCTIGDPLMLALPRTADPRRRIDPPAGDRDGESLLPMAKAAMRTAAETRRGADLAEALHLLELLGQDTVALELWRQMRTAGIEATAAPAAQAALGPLFRAGDAAGFAQAYAECLPTDTLNRDRLWHLVLPSVRAGVDPNTLLLLEDAVRPEQLALDAQRLRAAMIAAVGVDNANLALDRLIERTSDPALRERLRSLR
ncbi:MAG: hypothetical protein KDA22_02715 [Phycisphaerales bacterium]|nr:hypothetical protein [Phycisphaerales bacterium]